MIAIFYFPHCREEEEVQRLVAEMAGYRAAIQSALPCLLILFWGKQTNADHKNLDKINWEVAKLMFMIKFLGSWSDRHRRRKPCMMIPLIGEMLSSLGLIFCVYNTTWSLGMTVFMEVIFPGLTGGWFTLLMGMYSYMADLTTEDERTFRIGVLTLCYQVGVPIGLSVSGILLKWVHDWRCSSLSSMDKVEQLLRTIYCSQNWIAVHMMHSELIPQMVVGQISHGHFPHQGNGHERFDR